MNRWLWTEAEARTQLESVCKMVELDKLKGIWPILGVFLVIFFLMKLKKSYARSFDLLLNQSRSSVAQKSSKSTTGHPSTTARPFGEWLPSEFKRPSAKPYPGWSVYRTKPLAYRPFRHGTYHITMGIRRMSWDDWIGEAPKLSMLPILINLKSEQDNQYLTIHAEKAERILSRGDKCCRTAPEAFDAAMELLQELCAYLSQRYPTMYEKTETGIHNFVTMESFNITERPLKEDPMIMAARLIQDDLTILIEQPDGQYYLLAGSVLLPGSWRLEDKFGMPLSEIHISGHVPQYKEKLQRGMESFFRRVQPENPIVRHNYFFQTDSNIAWSSNLGSEDAFGGNAASSLNIAEPENIIENLWYRSERQSLRRLPRTGAIVFTVHTYFHPVTEIAKEPYVPGRLAAALRGWGDDVAKYKGRERYKESLLLYLDEMHNRQISNGLDMSKEGEAHSFPF